MYNKSMARFDVATTEARLQVVDELIRRGLSVHEVAVVLLTDHKDLVGSTQVKNYWEPSAPQVKYQAAQQVRQLVNKDLSIIRTRFRREINPEATSEGLTEYLSRLDYIYRQSVNNALDAVDHKDKNTALKIAAEVAAAKAKALGADLEPADRSKEMQGAVQGMATMAQFVKLAAAAKLPAPPVQALPPGPVPTEDEALEAEYRELMEADEDEEMNQAV